MKKQTISVFAAVLCAGSLLAGCGTSEPTTTTAGTQAATETSAPASTTAATVPETTEVTVPETSEATVPVTTAPAETTAPTESTAPASAGVPSGSYVNLDNMQFSINGKTYTLGKTTLQEMIDDGVPFEEDDLANANNNLNKNSQSQGFRIVLGEYWTAQVYAMNDTDSNKTAAECYVSEVYLPMKKDATQDILTFAFPLDMTMDQLKANAGEPTEERHYDGDNDYYSDTLEYTRESTKYIGDSGYSFEFTNGKLNYITIEYLP